MTEGATEKKRRGGAATLGVDLASQPKKTVAALIRWDADRATVELHLRADDAKILALARAAEVSGVDAPFGWPRPFVDFLAADGGARVREPDELYRFDPATGEGAWMGDGRFDLPASNWYVIVPVLDANNALVGEQAIYIGI